MTPPPPLPQLISSEPQHIVSAGQAMLVCFNDPTRANQQVTIALDNGVAGDGKLVDQVVIQLDENGNGHTAWNVPAANWPAVKMNHPASLEHGVLVQ